MNTAPLLIFIVLLLAAVVGYSAVTISGASIENPLEDFSFTEGSK